MDFRWIPLDFRWISVGFRWISVGFHWISLDFRWIQRKSNGIQRKSNGNPTGSNENPTEIQWKSSNILRARLELQLPRLEPESPPGGALEPIHPRRVPKVKPVGEKKVKGQQGDSTGTARGHSKRTQQRDSKKRGGQCWETDHGKRTGGQ